MSSRKLFKEVKAEIEQRYLSGPANPRTECEHSSKELRKGAMKDGRPQIRYQCLSCGQLIGGHVGHAQAGDTSKLPPIDEVLQKRDEKYWEQIREWGQKKTEMLNAAFWQYYEAYIQSPEWRRKREMALRRGNGVCEGCGLQMAEEVHHRSYDNLGDEFLYELACLCKECHQKVHPHREIA